MINKPAVDNPVDNVFNCSLIAYRHGPHLVLFPLESCPGWQDLDQVIGLGCIASVELVYFTDGTAFRYTVHLLYLGAGNSVVTEQAVLETALPDIHARFWTCAIPDW